MARKKKTAAREDGAGRKPVNRLLIELLMLNAGRISDVIEREGQQIFGRDNLLGNEEITDYSLEFLELFASLLHAGERIDRRGPEYRALREFFNTFSKRIRARGASLDEFVRYIQFLQRVFLENLDAAEDVSFEDARAVVVLLGSLFNDIILDIFHIYLEEKERTIQAQQEELRQTSTPVTEIWDGVLALPIIGTLDSSRAMMVMERLLTRIERDRAKAVVMDVTGVSSIDTQVSHHLVQMIRAISLMGAEPILTGIRPDIARSLTSLNIDLGQVTTRSTLAEGLKEAFRRLGVLVGAGAG